MRKIIDMAVEMYEEACGLEAVATWDNNSDMQKRADVAWSRYEGAKTLLSMVFGITEEEVDEEIEILMTEKTL